MYNLSTFDSLNNLIFEKKVTSIILACLVSSRGTDKSVKLLSWCHWPLPPMSPLEFIWASMYIIQILLTPEIINSIINHQIPPLLTSWPFDHFQQCTFDILYLLLSEILLLCLAKTTCWNFMGLNFVHLYFRVFKQKPGRVGISGVEWETRSILHN